MHKTSKIKCVIINADDYGCNVDIDRGISELIRDQHINSTSVLVNGEHVEEAAQILKQILKQKPELERTLSIGLHFNLTEGKPFSKSIRESQLVENEEFAGKPKIYQIAKNPKAFQSYQIVDELKAQVYRFIDLFGRKPSHVDGHNHVHIIPSIAGPLSEAMTQMGIYKTRIPLQKLQKITIPLNNMFLQFAKASKPIYSSKGIIYSKAFVGLQSFGNPCPQLLNQALQIQKGEQNVSVQMMCHPGYAAKQGNQWVMSKDRPRQMELLSNIFEEFKGYGCYHDLKSEAKTYRVLICYNQQHHQENNALQTLRHQFRQTEGQFLFWYHFQKAQYDKNRLDLQIIIYSMNITRILELFPSQATKYIKQASQEANKSYEAIAEIDNFDFQSITRITHLAQ